MKGATMQIEMKPSLQVWCDESTADIYLKHLKGADGKYYLVSDTHEAQYGIPAGHYRVAHVSGYIVPDDGLPPRLVEVLLERPSYECIRQAMFEDFGKLIQMERAADREVCPWESLRLREPRCCAEARMWAEGDAVLDRLLEEGLLSPVYTN
jgi:hypothetical protein